MRLVSESQFLKFVSVWAFVVACFAQAPADAGNYTINWGTAPFTWTPNALGPVTYTMTDQNGFQLTARFTVTQTNGVSAGPFPDDLLTDGGTNTFGTEISIWQVWNPNLTGGGVGGSPNTLLMEVLNNSSPYAVSSLSFRVNDIDSVDSNTAGFTQDRCDYLTFTGNAGNPSLTAITGTPTFLIGPGAGSGSTGALASNQIQCDFRTSILVTSPTSNGDNNGTALVTYPSGTHTATIVYDESIHNVTGVTSVNALARGVGIWGATAITAANNTISLDKQTSTVGYSSAGDTINYSFVVTNNGPLNIVSTQNIQISDSKIGIINCPAIPVAGIAVGGTHTCTGIYTVTAADVSANMVTNTAIAGVGTTGQAFASRLQSNSDAVTVPRYATLSLVKTVTNNNGGTAVIGNFTLAATGATSISGTSGSVGVTNRSVVPGVYALSETTLADYTASAWSCSAGTLAGSNLTLANGQTATCTINNNDTAPRLTLIKTVTDTSGGASTVPSFVLNATGPVTVSGITGSTAVTNAEVNVGTYALSETVLSGYRPESWSCIGGSLSGSNLTLTLAQNATCTINNVKLPTLTIAKISDGGTDEFNFTGTNGIPNQSITTASAGIAQIGSPAILTAENTATEITEVLGVGAAWALQSATCTGMGSGGTAILTGSTLALNAAATAAGRNITCTFTNLKLVPAMTIDKVANTGGPVSVGNVIGYTYTVTNTGNVAIYNVSIADVHNGFGIDPIAWSEVLLTDNGTLGDSTDTGINGMWNTLAPGDVIRFSASYSVVQADIDYLQ